MKQGQVRYGSTTGTGSAINISLGFVPAMVILVNETDPGFAVWMASMADAEVLKLTNAPALTFPTTNGISAYAGSSTPGSEAAAGFTIGADSDLNGASDVIHYFAIASDG